MRIKNLDKVKDILKSKLPEYLKELGSKIEGTKVQCPNTEAHEHGDKNKLSAAFLPKSNNQNIYCFVEQRAFDIFDIYAIKNNKATTGPGFYETIKELAIKYNVPIEEEYEYSMKEKELNRKREFLQKVHKIAIKGAGRGKEFYKKRRLDLDKAKHFQVGWLEPKDITAELNEECKTLFEYKLSSVFIKGGLVIPIFNKNRQYNGLVIRMFGTKRNDEYLKICISGSNLFNANNVRGSDELTIVEGAFDAIALHPHKNVVGCLTNAVNDANLEKIAAMKMQKIDLALDPDNFYKGKARDGILRTILKMKDLEAEINVVKFPEVDEDAPKPDPDDFMRDHTLEDYNNLPRIAAINYLIKNYEKKLIKAEEIYAFISACPDMIRKERYVNECHKALKISKRELTKAVDSVSSQKTSFNMIQYVQEKEHYDGLLEDFTEQAWNKNYGGIPSGYPVFDKTFGGFEDTLYLLIGFPEQGKTTFLLNFIYNLAHYENAFVAFYSLDDGAKRSVVPRLMSIASGLTSKMIKQPVKEVKDDWYKGLNKLKSLKDNLTIKDGSEIRTLEDLDNFVKIHSTMAEERDKKFIMVIDNLHDLVANFKLESVQNSQRIASYLKRLPQQIGCPIIATAEVPKSASGKPSGKDIKESIDLWYAARFVGGIFSNFHQAKSKSDTHLVWIDEAGKHQPIMELFVSKNQTGEAAHGSVFYKFSMTNNKLTECTEKEMQLLRDGQHLSYAE